jgi:hypothetical protein
MSEWFLEQRINIKFYVKLSLEVRYDAFNMIPKANDKFEMETSDIPTTREKVTWKYRSGYVKICVETA